MSRWTSWYIHCVLRPPARALTAEQRADYKPGTAINQACQAERAKFATEITHREKEEERKCTRCNGKSEEDNFGLIK